MKDIFGKEFYKAPFEYPGTENTMGLAYRKHPSGKWQWWVADTGGWCWSFYSKNTKAEAIAGIVVSYEDTWCEPEEEEEEST